ncbi:hypothetical protein GCM10020221_26520 [Streptomyces thioluteus]|uniref:Uncharacterized protein n=1 Tax=Streptomyces thioluteus TaxID=66431 RepID=A0ABN3WWW2_STRTU
MERSPNLPDPTRVAERAKEILSALKADPEFPAFEAASLKYDEGWSCFAGAPGHQQVRPGDRQDAAPGGKGSAPCPSKRPSTR